MSRAIFSPQRLARALSGVLACSGAALAAGPAGVKLDGSIGAPAQILGGPTYHITQNLGQLAGGNLFFSFQYFNVATGETALFSTSSAGINNVVSRVTGGYASSIDGSLRLQAAAGAPSFFFINPSGVTFTANASVDVPAAFHVSTAGYLRFPDGRFYVDPTRVSTLSSAPPEAFGFLGKTRAPVNLQGASLSSGGAAPLGIVAGDITIDGAGNLSGIGALGGDVRLIANGAQAGEVPLSGRFNATDGSITLENGGGVEAVGSATLRAGAVYVSAGAVTLDGGASGQGGIVSSGDAAGAAPILIDAGAVRVSNGAEIVSYTTGAGAAADIAVNASSLTLDGGSQALLTGIYSEALQGSSGDTGKLTLTSSGATTLANGGSITTLTIGTGNGSGIALNTGSLSIIGGAPGFMPEISSSTFLDGGSAGNIDVQVASGAVIRNGGQILSATNSAHDAGDVNVRAATLSIDGDTAVGFTGIASNTFGLPTAAAGHVTVNVDSLDMQGSTAAGRTTISSDSGSPFFDAGGTGGTVAVNVAGAATLSRGAYISSDTYTTGRGGDVTVTAGTLSIDNAGSSHATGISSSADQYSTGGAGDVTVVSTGAVRVVDGGLIRSDTYGSGDAGKVSVAAASLAVDGSGTPLNTGISSSVDGTALGNGGQVSITTTGAVTVTGGGGIVSVTNGHGDAGSVQVAAGSVLLDSTDAPTVSLLSSSANPGSTGNAGAVTVETPGTVTLSNGSLILSNTFGPGNAGNIRIDTGSLNMFGVDATTVSQISSTSKPGATGHAGSVSIDASGAVTLSDSAQILSSTFGSGNAGDITLSANTLTVDGTGGTQYDSIISSSAETITTTGHAGRVDVSTSGATSLLNGGQILSSTFGIGDAGSVTLQAGSIEVEGSNSMYLSQISSAAQGGSSGNAGKVQVSTPGQLYLLDGGLILSDTHGSGNAGDITVQAGTLALAGESTARGSDGMPAHQYSAVSSAAESNSTGNAGTVTVTVAGNAALYEGGTVLSDTRGPGNAGDVTFTAASLLIKDSVPESSSRISSSAAAGSTGQGGDVSVTTSGLTSIESGGQLLSATFSSGAAGKISLSAGSLSIDGAGSTASTGIFSGAHAGSSGIAGVVEVAVGGTATLANGAQISSAAQQNSSGQPGTVSLSAGTLVLNSGSQVSIEDDASIADPAGIAPTHIRVQAQDIRLNDGQITAASTGNVAASSIAIDFGHSLFMDPSSISTTSNRGNGGAIAITGSGVLWLDRSAITTSVLGSTNGNGGNIDIRVPFIVLDSGAIQANTRAPNATGGDVTIEANALVPSYSSYVLGGAVQAFDPQIAGLNVVQAAAPQGVSGTLNVTVPTLDLGSSLAGLSGHPAGAGVLARSPCSYRQGSSFSVGGRGGLPPSARGPLWVDAEGADAVSARRPTSAAESLPIALIACR